MATAVTDPFSGFSVDDPFSGDRVKSGCVTTDPTTLDPIRRDLQRWQDKLKSDAVDAHTQRALAALVEEARKLLREMESVLRQSRQKG